MPNNQKKRKKRKSLRELFKIGKCTSPETISPEIDDTAQNDQENGDIVEEHPTTDIEDTSPDKSYSDGYTTNTPAYNTDLAEQNKCDASDGDITNTPDYSTDLAEQNKCDDSDGDITNTPDYSTDLAEQNKCDASDGDITNTPDYSTDLAEQNKCDASDGDITNTPDYSTDLAEQNKCDDSDGDITNTPDYSTDLAEQNKCDDSDGDITNTPDYSTDLAEQNKCDDSDGDTTNTPDYSTDLAEQNKCDDSDGDITNTPDYSTDLAEQNKCDSDGDITNTPDYSTDLAEQNKCDSDGDITNTPDYSTDLAEQNKCDSDGDITNTPDYTTDLAEQNKCDSDGDITPEQRVLDVQNRYSSDGYDKTSSEHRILDTEQRRYFFDEMDITCKENDSISIGDCSLANSNEQICATSYEKHVTLSKGTGSLSNIDERINTTSNKEEDVTSIGACSLSDTDEHMAGKHADVKDKIQKSNADDSRKQKDVEDTSHTSPRTGLYIDPMVMDSKKEILLNMKNLIEQNVKQLKDMVKCKAQLNIAVHKAELRVDRTKKSNEEINGKIKELRAEFWKQAQKFPATVSVKPDKFDNWKSKGKQDLIDHLNSMKMKERLLKEYIPKLIKENSLRETWSSTVPVITFSPVIEQLNVKFLEEFGTIFRFNKLKPGIYFRHPFSRTTYHVAEEKVEDFKEKHPYFYYNCQRFIKSNDVGKVNQQTEEGNLYSENKQGCKEITEKDSERHINSDVENKQTYTNNRKATSLQMKRCDVIKMRNGQEDITMIDCSTGVKTQMTVTKPDKKTTKINYMKKENNNSADGVVKTKDQTHTKTTRTPIVEAKVNIGKAKTTQRKANSAIPKPRNRSEDKIRIETSRRNKMITRNDHDQGKKDQKNLKVDKKILERVEQLRKQGKDAFVKTSGGKSFIYIKPAASQGIETRSDKNKHLSHVVTNRSKPATDTKAVRKPPSSLKHTAVNNIGSINHSNAVNMSLCDNIRVFAKPVVVVGKTKIPLFIRQNRAYKTPTPRKQPNSNVHSPRVHLREGQSKRSVIQKKSKSSESEHTNTDILNKADRDKSNVDKETQVSKEKSTQDFAMSQKGTLNKIPKESRKPQKSLIPISVRYMKEKEERDQNKEVSREPTPYDDIITQVINEYLPLSIEESDDDDQEACENKPKNTRHDIIPTREKENQRTKEALKTEGKITNNGSPLLQKGDNVITRKSRNVILLPPITPTSSPTKRARSRSERCTSYKSEKQSKSNNGSLPVNINSTVNIRNSVSVIVSKNLEADGKMSEQLLEDTHCHLQRLQGMEKEITGMVPHPPESPKDRSYQRRRKVRTPDVGLFAAKSSNETNRTSAEALEQGRHSTENVGRDSFDALSNSFTTLAEHTNVNKDMIERDLSVNKCGDRLLENIDERMPSSVLNEQCHSGTNSLLGQSELRLPPIRNH